MMLVHNFRYKSGLGVETTLEMKCPCSLQITLLISLQLRGRGGGPSISNVT